MPCPPGSYPFNNVCYKFQPDRAGPEDDAKSVCEDMGGKLQHVDNVAEMQFLKSILKTQEHTTNIWIGELYDSFILLLTACSILITI